MSQQTKVTPTARALSFQVIPKVRKFKYHSSKLGNRMSAAQASPTDSDSPNEPPTAPERGGVQSESNPSETPDVGHSPEGGFASTASAREEKLRNYKDDSCSLDLGHIKLSKARFGFIGAGKMTECLVQGLMTYSKIPAAHIYVTAPSNRNLEHFKSKGCRITKKTLDIFTRYDCDVVFLCVHGAVIRNCYRLGDHYSRLPFPITTHYIPLIYHPLYIISLVPGASCAQIKECLVNPVNIDKYKMQVNRIMINAACAFGRGLCYADCEPSQLLAPVRSILSSMSTVEYLHESQMDAACGFAGSGLAFSYYFCNALVEGTTKLGIPRDFAVKLAAKTAKSAAQCCLKSEKEPKDLIETVASSEGGAAYGIRGMDKALVASGLMAAIDTSYKRVVELSEHLIPKSPFVRP